MSQANRLLEELGYEVLDCTDGVYWLKAKDAAKEFVAIFRTAADQATVGSVTFVLYELSDDMPKAAVLEHWRNIDARRLGAPDAAELELELSEPVGQAEVEKLSFLRPSGNGFRSAMRLDSGEVVCFN